MLLQVTIFSHKLKLLLFLLPSTIQSVLLLLYLIKQQEVFLLPWNLQSNKSTGSLWEHVFSNFDMFSPNWRIWRNNLQIGEKRSKLEKLENLFLQFLQFGEKMSYGLYEGRTAAIEISIAGYRDLDNQLSWITASSELNLDPLHPKTWKVVARGVCPLCSQTLSRFLAGSTTQQLHYKKLNKSNGHVN